MRTVAAIALAGGMLALLGGCRYLGGGPRPTGFEALQAGPGPWALDDAGDGRGTVVLQVEPADAEVYVDGVLQGRVEDFDGTRGALRLETGRRRLELRRAGRASYRVELQIEGAGRQTVSTTLGT